MSTGRVVIDLVAPQSPSYRERGIARHGLAFTESMVERHGDLIDRVLLHPELPPVGGLDRLTASGKVAPDLDGVASGGIFHLTSAFEPEVPIRALWPRGASARRMRLVVTLYDLIPDVFPDLYLVDPGLRRRWRACRELVRVADHVLTLSESGTADVVKLLGVPEHRVSAIGAGCDERFRPSSDRLEAGRSARAGVDGLGDKYIVYNGAIDPRKNLDRLIEAFARLPEHLRSTHQLVLVCRAEPLQRNHYLVMAERLGAADQVLLPGFVTDHVLVNLYQAATLVVFPSLYEGYGLPVVEARACGAPVIAADNSSLRELVDQEARFDGLDIDAITAAMVRGLTDQAFRGRLLATSAQPPPTWAAVADASAEVYTALLARDRSAMAVPGWRRRPRVAVIAPSEASLESAGTWAAHLVAALTRAGADVDRYVSGAGSGAAVSGADGRGAVSGADGRGAVSGADGRGAVSGADGPEAVSGAVEASSADGTCSVSAYASLQAWRGGYDLTVVCVGDHAAYRDAVGFVHAIPSMSDDLVVVAHQVELRRAYEAAAGGVIVDDLSTVIAKMYPGLVPGVGIGGRLPEAVARRHGLLLARHAIRVAGRFLVATADDAARAEVEAAMGRRARIEVMAADGPAPGSGADRRAGGDGATIDRLAQDLISSPRRRLAQLGGRLLPATP